MFDPQQYQLLDFGAGRCLERFGAVVLDRPFPAADSAARAAPQLWADADARFDGERWTQSSQMPATWTIGHGSLTFELKRTDFGHVGIFPEQAENWDWIAEQVTRQSQRLARPLKVLNLFAYTGGSTLAAAATRNAEVTHVDSARNTVAWARRNAELSGLQDSPIRWIAEDAIKFVRREIRRGKRYDALILDPPSYGHGPTGEVWQLDRHLTDLLATCVELTAGEPQFMLLTCHTPGYSAARLQSILAALLPAPETFAWQACELALHASTGHTLPSGVVVRGCSRS